MSYIRSGIYNQDDELKNAYQLPNAPPMSLEIYPISLHYFEEVQQESFWSDFVAQFRGDRLKIGPKLYEWRQKLPRYGEIETIDLEDRCFDRDMVDYQTSSSFPSHPNPNPSTNTTPPSPTDPYERYRQTRLSKTRHLARRVQENIVRNQKQESNVRKVIAMSKSMAAQVKRIEDEHEVKKTEWLREMITRQDRERVVAEGNPGYRIPGVVTFEEYLRNVE